MTFFTTLSPCPQLQAQQPPYGRPLHMYVTLQHSIQKRAHQQMRYPNVTWPIILYGYLFTTELRTTHQSCSTPKYFWSNAYTSNGRRFTKSTFRILLLSTHRVSRINYSLVCSLPIHTRSSVNAEGPRAHTVSWNRVIFCTNVRQIATGEWPSRSFKVTAVAAIW